MGHAFGVFAAFALLALANCGRTEPPAAAPPDRPHVQADGFDPRTLDLDRPCTLLREVDAERLTAQPFYRTIAANRVDGDRVRCAQAVGAGGLHSLVETTVVTPSAGRSASDTYDALCRAESIEGPRPEAYAVAPTSEESAPPPIPGRACKLANTSYAILSADRVVITWVRGGSGEIDSIGSQRAAALLASRVAIDR